MQHTSDSSPTSAPAASWWSRHQMALVPWLFLAPALVMFMVYVIAPIFESIALSFYDWDGLGKATYIGFGNYKELMDDPDFHVALKNNVIWFFGFLLAIPMGLGLALLLNQEVFGIRLAKSLFFFPFFPWLILFYLINSPFKNTTINLQKNV